ncbi:MAG: hypothetical protein ACR2OY_13540 [Boseongicola sp.]
MQALVWIGAILTLLGVVGLTWCVIIAFRAKRAGLSDAEMKNRLQKVVALNMGALAISAIGLMCVVLGLFLT